MKLKAVGIVLIVGYACLDQYVFRFQRTTRGISQLLSGAVDHELQLALTPSWVGVFGWLNKAFALLTAAVVWAAWGWTAAAGFVLYVFVFGILIDLVSPLPTYRHCFKVITRGLKNDGQTELLRAVEDIQGQYLGSWRRKSGM